MSDELPPSKTGRRIGIAVALALLVHAGLFLIARVRHGAAPAADTADHATAVTATEPEPSVAIDLSQPSPPEQPPEQHGPGPQTPEPSGRFALATDLRSAEEQFQPETVPVFDKPPPLPRERLAYSAALGDGDSGRRGFHFDELLPVLREIAALAVGRRPAPVVRHKPVVVPRVEPPEDEPADSAPTPSGDRDALLEAQARAAAEATAQPVPMQRIAPRDELPPPPAPPEVAAANDAEVGQFFGALTAQLVSADQRSLAEAVRAGVRETINVRFIVDREGRVDEVQPVTPSDSPELDERAVRVVMSAAPLPRPPPGLPQSRLQLTFPVQVYR